MKHFILFALVVFAFSTVSFGQQDYFFSQTYSNPYLNNVAAAGTRNLGEVALSSRFQFTGLNGAPQSHLLSVNSPVRFKRKPDYLLGNIEKYTKKINPESRRTLGGKHVAGVKAFKDEIGPFSASGLSASYGVHVKLTQKANLGVGLGAGFRNFSIDQNRVQLESPIDVAYAQYYSQSSSQNHLQFSTGLVFYTQKMLVSWGINQLFNQTYKPQGTSTSNFHTRHNTLQVAYQFGTLESYIEPQVVIRKAANSPANLDLIARVYNQNYGSLLLGFRSRGQLLVGFGVNVMNHFSMGYNIELITGKTQGFGSGTHEVQFSYRFGHTKKEIKATKENDFEPLEKTPNTEAPTETKE